MKKIAIFLLLLFLTASLSVSVSAAEDHIGAVSVDIISPLAGIKASEAPIGETRVVAVVGDVETEFVPNVDFDVHGFSWKEKDTGIALGDEDLFISGRTYVLEVNVELITRIPVTEETLLSVGGKEGTIAQSGVEGEKLKLFAEFLAIPADFEPKVSLTVEGEKTKEFDGKGITLTALLDELGGISYEYAWYRDMVLIEGATESRYTVRDVSQSGKYLCAVTARVTDDPTIEPKTSRTASQDVEITPTVITLQIEDAEKNLADPDPKFSYTILGNVCDPLYGSLQRAEGEDIGKYSILIGSLSFAADKIANYQILVKQGTLTILDVGKLPFSAVADIADLSYILGAQKAKIRASASKGALPAGAILSLSTAPEETRNLLSEKLGHSVMKAFQVRVVSKEGKELSLPKHGTLRFQIPLTEEEAALELSTIKAGFYEKSAELLEVSVEEQEGVTYLSLEVKGLGTIALFDGEKKAAVPTDKPVIGGKEDNGRVWLWVLIATLSVAAVSGIVITVVLTAKNKKRKVSLDAEGVKIAPGPDQKKKAGEEEKDPLAEALSTSGEEKEKQAKIARELNEKSPVPEKEKPKKKAAKTVISFEDLED